MQDINSKKRVKSMTFKQFLATFNFRKLKNEDVDCQEYKKLDSYIVKLSFDDNFDEFVKIGIYDFGDKKVTLGIAEKYFSKKVMNSFVYDIYVSDEDNDVLVNVVLTDHEMEII